VSRKEMGPFKFKKSSKARRQRGRLKKFGRDINPALLEIEKEA
jgi:hypothetical protein